MSNRRAKAPKAPMAAVMLALAALATACSGGRGYDPLASEVLSVDSAPKGVSAIAPLTASSTPASLSSANPDALPTTAVPQTVAPLKLQLPSPASSSSTSPSSSSTVPTTTATAVPVSTTSAPTSTVASVTIATTATSQQTDPPTTPTTDADTGQTTVMTTVTSTGPSTIPVTLVEFRIAAGTGSSPWNSASSPVRVSVGQTLRIHNDDTVDHAVHSGGAPFKHGQTIRPGEFRDHLVTVAYSPDPARSQLYDHQSGRGAAFWVAAS